MKKKDKKDNVLIKKKNLAGKLKKLGIKRVNSKSLYEIEKFVNEEIEQFAALLKEILTIKGKRTLAPEDVKEGIKKLKKKKQDNYEI